MAKHDAVKAQHATGDAHVRVFKLEAEEVAEIIRRKEPLDADKLAERPPDEVYSLEVEARLRETEATGIPLPAAIGNLVFPQVVIAQRFFCFCIGYVWCLERDRFGRVRYILKCRQFCIPQFEFAG